MAVLYDTILVGDIGGTNTRLVMYQIRRDDPQLRRPLKPGRKAPGLLLKHEKYLNQEYKNFTEVVTQFLHEANLQKPPLTACFAVAGPVKDNSVTFTNRSDWTIDGYRLEVSFGIAKVTLCNDFLAVGYGLLTLEEDTECEILQNASKQQGAPIACIGAGTGLGECFLTPSLTPRSYSTGNSTGDVNLKSVRNNSHYEFQCFPSEGGHAEYSPRNAEQTAMMEYLKKKFSQDHRISVERVVSGTGLVNIYEYLSDSRPGDVDSAVNEEIAAAGDLKGAIIAKYQSTDKLCQKTMNIFLSAYGAEAGVAALKWLPYGGLYLTGGLTPKNMSLITDPNGPFIKAFRDKGRVSGMLDAIPLYAVKVEDLGERGAHLQAFKELQEVLGLSNANEAAASSVGKRRAAALKWLASLMMPISAAYIVTVVAVAGIVIYRKR